MTDQTCETMRQYFEKDLSKLIESNNDLLWINVAPTEYGKEFSLTTAHDDTRIIRWAQNNVDKHIQCALVRKGNKNDASSDLYFGGSQSWLVNLNEQCNFVYQYKEQIKNSTIEPGQIVSFDPRYEYCFTFNKNIAYTIQFYSFY